MKDINSILLWGHTDDDAVTSVRDALSRLSHRVLFINQEHDLFKVQVDLFVDDAVQGIIRLDKNNTVDLESVTAAYLRPLDWHSLSSEKVETNNNNNNDISSDNDNNDFSSDNDSNDRKNKRNDMPWREAAYTEDRLWCWSELTSALVINRPSAMASNGSKPYQALQIQSVGFEIPDTLITTDATAVLEFWKQHEKLIYKSISGVRSIVSQLTSEHLGRLNDTMWCPTQFQQYIPGNDYRVHVVGDDDIFACQIISSADDYRYAARKGFEIQITPCQIPNEIRDRCIMLARSLGLVVAGIDLRRTQDDRWYCFEVNPSPGFTYYQNLTGQPIDEAIAQVLIKASAK